MCECAWPLAEKRQEEHRALTPADLSSQPEGCELRASVVSQPRQRTVRNGKHSEAEGSWIHMIWITATTYVRAHGMEDLASVADLGGYNADRSWST